MNEILEYANKLVPLTSAASDAYLNAFELKAFPKGTYILRAEQVCNYFYFIKSGLTKSHFFKGNKEFIMTFFNENRMFTEISSYLTERSSKYMILTLEETTVYQISKRDVEELCKKHHCLETLFSKLFQLATLGMMKRISEMLEENATESYNKFLDENSELLQRISLGDLSNYLGITQVSLSRIRAGK